MSFSISLDEDFNRQTNYDGELRVNLLAGARTTAVGFASVLFEAAQERHARRFIEKGAWIYGP